jgi:limonene-1,2-epoxide hydrolase
MSTSRQLLEQFWRAMQENDWTKASGFLAPECAIDWPCSGERILGPANFAAIQAGYPTRTGRWSFEIHRIVEDGRTVVSEVTVSDGEQSARVIAFSEIEGDHIAHQVEYWPIPYDPMPGREGLTQRIERIP